MLVPNFFTLAIGRALQGICIGLYSAAVPLFITELSPVEIYGGLGSLHMLLLICGIIITNLLIFLVPPLELPMNEDDVIVADYPIWDYWWVIFGLPLIIAALQIVLLTGVFRRETPRYLYSEGRDAEALEVVKSIYKEEYVEEMAKEKKAEV